jgi:hypothetical protein
MDHRFGRFITRRNLQEIPVTDLVIQALENMTVHQGLTTLKSTNRTTQSWYPADWIAGLDCEDTDSNNKDYNQPERRPQ